MSYKYCLVFTVFLIFKYNSGLSSLLLECVRFSVQSEILFLLLVYLYLKLLHNMPSLVIVDDASDQLFDRRQEQCTGNVTTISTTTSCKSNLEQLFATIKPSAVSRKYFDRNYSDICKYFNNVRATSNNGYEAPSSHAKIEEVKKLYLQPESNCTPPHNDVLENDKFLFTPGKVSQIAEIFSKQFGVSTATKKRPSNTSGGDDSGTQPEDEDVDLAWRSSPPNASYAWVFGDSKSTRNVDDLAEMHSPPAKASESDVNPSLGELSSFKRTTNVGGNNNNLTNNDMHAYKMVNQQACEWRSMKNELKSNLEKLKPVAVIDPLNLPVKLNAGLEMCDENENRIVMPRPCLPATNTDATTNEYVEEGFENCEYAKGEEEKQYTIERYYDRSLSPILETEHDTYSSTLSVSSERSSSMDSGEFCLNSYRTAGMLKYETDENDNVKYTMDECDGMHVYGVDEQRRYFGSISLPANVLEARCKSECQVFLK